MSIESSFPSYIAFEGISRCGKTTQIELLEQVMKQKFVDRQIFRTREPGGTTSEISSAIRKVVIGTSFVEEMDPFTEAFLFAAARRQSIAHEVLPVLNKGGIVLSDRTVYSSIAFQGYARGTSIEALWEVNKHALHGLTPGLIFLINISVEESKRRKADIEGDRLETMHLEALSRAHQGYLRLAAANDTFHVINGEQAVGNVHEEILVKLGL